MLEFTAPPRVRLAEVAVMFTVPAVTAPPEIVRPVKLTWTPKMDRTPASVALPTLIGAGLVPLAIAFRSLLIV